MIRKIFPPRSIQYERLYMIDLIRSQVERSIAVKQDLLQEVSLLKTLEQAGHALSATFQCGGKLLCCGNGGSAADAQHIATEFVIRYRSSPERPSLPAISLAADSSALTAAGNDFSFAQIFARQVEGLGKKNDFLLAISTSGRSENILAVLATAKKKQMKTILFTGGSSNDCADTLVDYRLAVPSQVTARIQECHILLGHILCSLVESKMFDFSAQ